VNERNGAVGLRVHIDKQNPFTHKRDSGSDVNRGRRFTHASLLVGDSDDQWVPPVVRSCMDLKSFIYKEEKKCNKKK